MTLHIIQTVSALSCCNIGFHLLRTLSSIFSLRFAFIVKKEVHVPTVLFHIVITLGLKTTNKTYFPPSFEFLFDIYTTQCYPICLKLSYHTAGQKRKLSSR